jgi:2,3-bisphosphoglycerate-dependent phosphoglycerate mutase
MRAGCDEVEMQKHLLLIRHCTSTGQAPEAELSTEGHRQAALLADRLADAGIERIVSSPYRRALETIAPLASRLGLSMEIDARLAERRLSPVPLPAWREVVARSFDDPEHRAPGGESGRETLDRGWAALRDAAAHPAAVTALVSHGQISSLLLHRIGPPFGYVGWIGLSNPDVYRIDIEGDDWRYRRVWSPA